MTEKPDPKTISMQTPGPRPAPTGTPEPADDRTVVLTTHAIRRAQALPATRRQVSPPAPRPHRPAAPPGPTAGPTADPSAALVAGPGQGRGDGGEADDAPKLTLTSTQVVASMSAAVAAAFIGAQLGVAGTILGAAIASIVSVVGSAVIGHSLLLTRRKVTQTVHQVRSGAGSPADAADTVLLTAVTRQVEITRAGPAQRAPATGSFTGSSPGRTGWWSRPGRVRRLLVGLAASVAVFAGALAAVTVVEAVTGTPISGGSSGFSVLGGSGGGSGDAPPLPSPTTVPETTTMTTTSAAASSSTAPSTSPSAPSPTSSSPPPSTTASTTPPTSGSEAPTTASSTPAPAAGVVGATTAG